MPTFTARTALPYPNAERASMGLRGQLRYEIAAAELTESIDWSSLAVTGPVESRGALGRIWFEYAATITVGQPAATAVGGVSARAD